MSNFGTISSANGLFKCHGSLGPSECRFCHSVTHESAQNVRHSCRFDAVGDVTNLKRCSRCNFGSFSNIWLYLHKKKCCNLPLKKQTYNLQVLSTDMTQQGQQWLNCDKCDFTTIHKSHLRYHKNQKHPVRLGKFFHCTECSFKTRTNVALQLHVNVKHTPIELRKLFKCGYCDFKTAHKRNVKVHLTNKHKSLEEWSHCDECEFKTMRKRALDYHKSIHFDLRKRHKEDQYAF